jgi:hypothetical protein
VVALASLFTLALQRAFLLLRAQSVGMALAFVCHSGGDEHRLRRRLARRALSDRVGRWG